MEFARPLGQSASALRTSCQLQIGSDRAQVSALGGTESEQDFTATAQRRAPPPSDKHEMETLIERAFTPETARNLSLLLAVVVLAWRPASALLLKAPATRAVYDLLVCGVGLLALLRFDTAMVTYAAAAFEPEASWLRVALPGISAAMYAATWSLLFGSILPWVFQRGDSADGPQNWRERLTGALFAAAAAYLVAFFVAPLPNALEREVDATRAAQQSLHRQAQSAFYGQRLVAADVVCTAARSLYMEARTRNSAALPAATGRVASELDGWRLGLGLPGFGNQSFQARCADVVGRRHPWQLRQVMQQWDDVSNRLRKAGLEHTLPPWPELDDVDPTGTDTSGAAVIDLSSYVSRTFFDPAAQVQYALARTDGATIFQLVMELVLVLMAWPATRIGRAPSGFQPEPGARPDETA